MNTNNQSISMDSKEVMKYVVNNTGPLLKYFGSTATIKNLMPRYAVTATDFNNRKFSGWLFTITYSRANETTSCEIVIDSEGYLRTVSGWGTGRTIYSQALKYYHLYPELNQND